MKALSLWQPWAAAIACGMKRVETRSWSTNYRGPIAIHAAKTWNHECARAYGWMTEQKDFYRLLPRDSQGELLALPMGAIVAVADLYACERVESLRDELLSMELALGNYSDGRFAWVLRDIRPLARPLPMVGRQGLFNLPFTPRSEA